MTTDRPRRPKDPFAAAEAMFAKKRAPDPKPAASSLPQGREMVSLRIDREVLEHFQAAGPGWQDRINEALRAAVEAERAKED